MLKRNSKKIAAIIPARKGSERVKNKNTKRFAGKSLLEIKIEQLLRVKCFNEIILSTNCEVAKNIASKYNIIVHNRSDYYCSSSVPINEVYEHLSSITNYNHLAYVHLTSPLVKDSSIKNIFDCYQKLKQPYDSVASVELLKHYIWYNGKAINYDPSSHPRSQDLPRYYSLNFAINILPKNIMKEKKNIVGNNFFPFFLDKIESIDVDTPEEFKLAELFYKELYEKN